MNLNRLFKPDTIAVIGASAKEGSAGKNFMKVISRVRENNSIYPINPKYENILGIRTLDSISEMPDRVDVAYVLLSAEQAVEAVEQCVEKEVGAVIVMAGGFSEKGKEKLENRMYEAVKGTNTRIVGPNCMGVHSKAGGISFPNTSPSPRIKEKKGNVSFISQSGGIASFFKNLLIERGCGISKLVSTGNEADLQFTDYLKYLEDDEETDVIAGYVEQIKNGKEFLKIGKKVSRKKPIILLKVGRGKAGKRAAKSHTGSIAGSSKIYSGIFKQAGIIEAKTLNELVDYATTFSCLKHEKIKKTGLTTGPGGLAILIADACDENNIKLPKFSKDLQIKLNKKLPPYTQVKNPLDLTFAVVENPEILRKSLKTLSKAKQDIDLIIWGEPGPIIKNKKHAQILKEFGEKNNTPLAVVFPAINSLNKEELENIRILANAGVPSYPTAGGLTKSIKALDSYKRFHSEMALGQKTSKYADLR